MRFVESCSMRALTATLVYIFLHTSSAFAFQSAVTAGSVRATFFAPDWTWQKSSAASEMGADVNVLGTLENVADIPVEVSVSLRLPPPESGFAAGADTQLTQIVSLQPGEIRRLAFVQIAALGTAPVGTHPFQLALAAGGERRVLPFSVRAIRGAVVSQSAWAKLLPAIISLGWCLVLWIALRPWMRRGTWREPYAPDLDGGGGS